MKKRMLSLLLCGAMCTGLLSGCGNASSAEVLNVYNWGEYIDTDLIDQFEEETGIKVIYNTFDSNETCIRASRPRATMSLSRPTTRFRALSTRICSSRSTTTTFPTRS